ncbi:MAG TPA: YidC/Oxa1 family membrane protein insertase [Solirubrobacteraceae bacterium]|jgi:YidC/Oxa1 family membrane protein insertase|nr:YidC/Oxa1 family membrane protein insertase [Solirubrobacteraceae bacterium]
MIAPFALLPPIQVIVDLLKPVLIFIHDTVGVSWGFSIVLLTVIVRALMAPLTVKQFKSMQSMVRVAPQLKEIQAKYKDDKQRQQQEVMKFYAEHKINPFASCLPLVAQLPFFIGLFYLLQSDLRNEICKQSAKPCGQVTGAGGPEQFLFVPDLTAPAHGWVLAVLIVLYIGSQLLSSILTPSTGDRNQRMIMYGLPFVFTFFIINFPAGLIVYWITTNLWTVGQGYILRRKIGPITPPKLEPAVAGGGGGAAARDGGGEGGIGGFFARLTGAVSAPAGSDSGSRPGSAAREPERAGAKSGAKTAAAKTAAAKSTSTSRPAPAGPPPRPPRKKKKRSGRRR